MKRLISRNASVMKDAQFEQGHTKWMAKIFIVYDATDNVPKFIGATQLDLDDEHDRLHAECHTKHPNDFNNWWMGVIEKTGNKPEMTQIEQIRLNEANLAMAANMMVVESNGVVVRAIYERQEPESEFETEHEKMDRDFVKLLKIRGINGVTVRELSRTRFGKFSGRELKTMTSRCVDAGDALWISIKTAGRPREVWVHPDFREMHGV